MQEVSLGIYTREKETKNTVRYSQGSQTQYVNKTLLGNAQPNTIEVLIKFEENGA